MSHVVSVPRPLPCTGPCWRERKPGQAEEGLGASHGEAVGDLGRLVCSPGDWVAGTLL